ncbi:adenylate/guanylate cyclase domain-containing protein [Janibacter sp. G1551]|uniref:adenylate/guanylate cyclase domain-containing protein n=1 Tax=Janibacter sp. G1551 TaxID=3420440 RepID=UPI003CFED07C
MEGKPTPDSIEQALLGRPASLGRREVSRGAGVSIRSARKLWHALGFPQVPEGEAMFTEADSEALAIAARMVREGGYEEEFILAMTRALARNTDRLAVWQTQLVSEALAGQAAGFAGDAVEPDSEEGGRRGVTPEVARETARQLVDMVDVLEPLLVYAWRRQLTAALSRFLADADPTTETLGHERTVGFADLVNFTNVVRRLSETELGHLVQRFEVTASDIITAHGGRVIKTVGDEVMFTTHEAAPAAAIALDLVEACAEDDVLPDVRVGMAYGPVISRLGDVFGTTVNRASRLTAVTPKRGVFVDDALTRRLAALSGFETWPERRRVLRGIGSVTPSRLQRSTGARVPGTPHH